MTGSEIEPETVYLQTVKELCPDRKERECSMACLLKNDPASYLVRARLSGKYRGAVAKASLNRAFSSH